MKKITLLFTVLVLTTALVAQDSATFNFTYNHTAISVKNVDTSAAFYKRIFQLNEITNRSKIEGIRWLSFADGKELHLLSMIKEKVTANKALHIAFTTQNFDAFVKRLEAMSVAYSDWPGAPRSVTRRADGVKQIYLQDPDGYWIEVNNGYAAAPLADDIKNEVWQLEEHYWKYVKEQNLHAYLALWDDKFIGYPNNNIITAKDHITDWIAGVHKNANRHFNYKLIRKVENIFDDIVIVLYDVNYTWTNDKNQPLEKSAKKITHTWKKTANGWLIIGGMGATK